MDRHKAYKLMTRKLEEVRGLTVEGLDRLVEQTKIERLVADGEEFLCEAWARKGKSDPVRYEVLVTVVSPSTYRYERIEKSVWVSPS